jgi:hypothetical protein
MLIRTSELIANPGRSGVLGPLVAEMRDVLTSESGKEWWAWAALTGRPYGTFSLSARFADYTDLVNTSMQLAMSPAWAEVAAKADGVLAHPAPTDIAEVIAVTGDLAAAPKQFVVATTATLSGKDMGTAIAWSTEIAEHVTKLTGHSVLVGMSTGGTMYRLVWVAGADTAEEIDAADKAISGDAGYLEMIAQSGNERMFIEGTSQRSLLVKMP